MMKTVLMKRTAVMRFVWFSYRNAISLLPSPLLDVLVFVQYDFLQR
jgi:hypothetical protein